MATAISPMDGLRLLAKLQGDVKGGVISQSDYDKIVTFKTIPTGLAKLGADITKAITGNVVKKVTDDGTALKEVNAELDSFYSKAGSTFEKVVGTGIMASAALGVAAAALPASVAASSAAAGGSSAVGGSAAVGGTTAIGGGTAAATGLQKILKAAKAVTSDLIKQTGVAGPGIKAEQLQNPGPPVPSAPANATMPAWLIPVAFFVAGLLLLTKKNFFK